jgi:hypothetical protein
MKYVLFALCLSSCGYASSLKDVADKVPVAVVCPEPNDDAAAELLGRFKSDPDLVEEELRNTAVASPMGALDVTCQLLNEQRWLVATGKRISEADTLEKLGEALDALEVLK